MAPICYRRVPVSSGQTGIVAGWNLPNEQLNSVLKVTQMPFAERSQCATKNVPSNIIDTNFCAGSEKSTVRISNEDVGSGWFYPVEINNRIKYYLGGVIMPAHLVSVASDYHLFAEFSVFLRM